MKTFNGKDYEYRTRKPYMIKESTTEYFQLANSLKNLVDSEGYDVYTNKDFFVEFIKNNGQSIINENHIKMITLIESYIRLLCDTSRYIDEENITEQMYYKLLTNGYSRNVISDFLYAVFFSLNKELKLSQIEMERLPGSDFFSYTCDLDVTVKGSNIIEEIESRVKESDNNAMVELGHQILIGNIKKHKNKTAYAINLCETGMNHGSGKAAQILGNENIRKAKHRLISNDDYSKAFEYYTAYGVISDGARLRGIQSDIVDILNLGLYNRKMIVSYIVIAIIFSTTFFMPTVLNELGLTNTLMISSAGCIALSLLEFAAVIFGIIVRHLRPFFTQGWIVLVQSLIWFVGLVIMIF